MFVYGNNDLKQGDYQNIKASDRHDLARKDREKFCRTVELLLNLLPLKPLAHAADESGAGGDLSKTIHTRGKALDTLSGLTLGG